MYFFDVEKRNGQIIIEYPVFCIMSSEQFVFLKTNLKQCSSMECPLGVAGLAKYSGVVFKSRLWMRCSTTIRLVSAV